MIIIYFDLYFTVSCYILLHCLNGVGQSVYFLIIGSQDLSVFGVALYTSEVSWERLNILTLYPAGWDPGLTQGVSTMQQVTDSRPALRLQWRMAIQLILSIQVYFMPRVNI